MTHIPFAYAVMSALRPRVLVELGTHAGDSYLAFAQAVEQLGIPCACYAVDTWEGDPHAGIYGEDVFQSLAEYHDRKYSAFSTLMRTTFEDAAAHFPEASVDLLHIDGFHTYDAVRGDFETWLPKMSGSGVVLFHDINVRQADFGVWRFWEEVCFKYPSFAFVHGHGLGVLAVGHEVPTGLSVLLDPDRDQSSDSDIRACFAKLGKHVEDIAALDHCRRASDDLAGRISELQTSLASEVARSSDLEARLVESQARLGELVRSRSWRIGNSIVNTGRRFVPR